MKCPEQSNLQEQKDEGGCQRMEEGGNGERLLMDTKVSLWGDETV